MIYSYKDKEFKDLASSIDVIPKIIFRTYKNNIYKISEEIYKIYLEDININKDYKLFYFDDQDCQDFIDSLGNERLLKAYNKLIPSAFKADLFRYAILYMYGGIYIDYAHRPLLKYDNIIEGKKEIFVRDIIDDNGKQLGIYNAFMCSVSHNIIFNKALDIAIKIIENNQYGINALDVTGCQVLGRAYNILNNKPELSVINCNEKISLKNHNNKYILDNNDREIIKLRDIDNYYVKAYSENFDSEGFRPKTHYHNMWKFRDIYKDDRWIDIKKLYIKNLDREGDLSGIYYYHKSHHSIEEIDNILKSSEEHENVKKKLNRIPIIMPTYNRPDYLINCLSHLSKCKELDKFFILTSEEPNEEISKIWDYVDFINVVRNKNSNKLGCNPNIDKSINYGLYYDKFVFLEDDLLPSVDFLQYFLWAFEECERNKDLYLIQAYSNSDNLDNHNLVNSHNKFRPWGWGCLSERYKHIKKLGFIIEYNRDVNEFSNLPMAWDSQLDEFVENNNILVMKPYVSRIQNIGEFGTWVQSPEWHKEKQFCKSWMGDINLLDIEYKYQL